MRRMGLDRDRQAHHGRVGPCGSGLPGVQRLREGVVVRLLRDFLTPPTWRYFYRLRAWWFHTVLGR